MTTPRGGAGGRRGGGRGGVDRGDETGTKLAALGRVLASPPTGTIRGRPRQPLANHVENSLVWLAAARLGGGRRRPPKAADDVGGHRDGARI